jgi:hypothetical protein
VAAAGNRHWALRGLLGSSGWENRRSARRKAHRLDLAPEDASAGVETLGQGLGIVVGHSPGGEALPDRAGQVV